MFALDVIRIPYHGRRLWDWKPFLCTALVTILLNQTPASAIQLEWLKALDYGGWDVACDALGDVYVGGNNVTDNFLGRFDTNGNQLWMNTWDRKGGDGILFAPDGRANVYVSVTELMASTKVLFLRRYTSDSELVWSHQVASSSGAGITVDGLGNVYAKSVDHLDKYDPDGALLWTRQNPNIGRSNATADAFGNVYISGSGDDIYKYDSDGNLSWNATYNGLLDEVVGIRHVAADNSGNVYTAAPMGFHDPVSGLTVQDGFFLAKHDSDGHLQWFQKITAFGTIARIRFSADSLGNVFLYVGGRNQLTDDYRNFLLEYDTSGKLIWTQENGLPGQFNVTGVSADGRGNVYFAGITVGDTSGSGPGPDYSFLAKFTTVPEPSSVSLGMIALLAAVALNRSGASSRFTASSTRQ
ncbi:MAG: PQQ-binding-like beta-propeller repeat protein [Pirellulales bacterium]